MIAYQRKASIKKKNNNKEMQTEEIKIIATATSSNQLKLSFPFVRPLTNIQTNNCA